MNATKSEALDMFRKWFGEKTPLRCQIIVSRFATAFTVRIFSVSEDLIVAASGDLRTEMNIPLTDDLFFGWAHAGNVENNTPYESSLVIFLAPVPPVGRGQFIAFSEFIEPPAATNED